MDAWAGRGRCVGGHGQPGACWPPLQPHVRVEIRPWPTLLLLLGGGPPPKLNHGVILCPPRGPASAFLKTLGCGENQRRATGRSMSSPGARLRRGKAGFCTWAPRLVRTRGRRGHCIPMRPRRRPAPRNSARPWQHPVTFTGDAPMPPRGPMAGWGRILPLPVPCPPPPESPATLTPEPQTVKCFSQEPLFRGPPRIRTTTSPRLRGLTGRRGSHSQPPTR